MASKSWTLFILLICALLLGQLTYVRANDDVAVEDDEEPTTMDEYEEEVDAEAGGPHPDIETVVYFPDAADRKFAIGEIVTALVGFSNVGHGVYNITALGAYFLSPFDQSFFIQNFSAAPVGVVIDGGRQVTLEYRFIPDKSLEAVEFWLSGWVEYNDTQTNTVHRSTWTNGTIELIDNRSSVDIKQTLNFLFTVGGVVVMGYLYMALNGSTKPKKKPVEQGAKVVTETTDADWGTIYKPKSAKAKSPEVVSPKPVKANKTKSGGKKE